METELKNTAPDNPSQAWKKGISFALRIMVSIVVLYFIFSLVQWRNVLLALQTADAISILSAALLLCANIGIRTIKWHTMLRTVKEKPTYAEAFGSVMLGISFGSFTPGEIGDFAGRALHVTDAKRSHLVGLTLLDKAQIFILTGGAGLISLACLVFDNPYVIASSILIVFLLSGVLVLRLGLAASLGRRINATLFKKNWISGVLDGFDLLNRRQLFVTILYTLIFHLVLILQMYFLINSFASINFTHTFIGTSAMMFVKSMLPISIGDLGIREAGSIFFFSTYGISQAAALNASLLLFFINVFIPSLLGTYFIKLGHFSALTSFQFLKKK